MDVELILSEYNRKHKTRFILNTTLFKNQIELHKFGNVCVIKKVCGDYVVELDRGTYSLTVDKKMTLSESLDAALTLTSYSLPA